VTAVSNSYTSNNPDIDVKDRTTSDGKKIQAMYLDVGAGSSESPVTAANPLPVTATVSGTVAISSLPNEGQQTMANSISVTLPSDAHHLKGLFPLGSVSPAITDKGTPVALYDFDTNLWYPMMGNAGNLYTEIINAGGVDAVKIQDGGNTITVDGTVAVSGISAGSNLIGDVQLQPRASSTGWDKVMFLDIDSTAQTIKSGAGKLGGYYIFNASAATVYVKIYNLTSVNPASDVPVMALGVPAGSAANLSDANGIGFSTGIMVRAVTAVGNTSTGDPGVNAIVATFWYK